MAGLHKIDYNSIYRELCVYSFSYYYIFARELTLIHENEESNQYIFVRHNNIASTNRFEDTI